MAPVAASPARLLTRRECAQLLRISLPALDKFCRDPRDPLPMLAAGRRHLFREEAVLRWAERQGKRRLGV